MEKKIKSSKKSLTVYLAGDIRIVDDNKKLGGKKMERIDYNDLFCFLAHADDAPVCKGNVSELEKLRETLFDDITAALDKCSLDHAVSIMDAVTRIWAADRPLKFCPGCKRALPASRFYLDGDSVCCRCEPDDDLDRLERAERYEDISAGER